MRLTLHFYAKDKEVDEAVLQPVPTSAIQPILSSQNPLEEYLALISKGYGMEVFIKELAAECKEHQKNKHRLVWGYEQ